MVYSISYDLRKSGRDYASLYDAIKTYGMWWHQTGYVWFIVTRDSAVSIRDNLLRHIDKNDKLFIVALRKNWAGAGFTPKEYDWLKSLPDASWE